MKSEFVVASVSWKPGNIKFTEKNITFMPLEIGCKIKVVKQTKKGWGLGQNVATKQFGWFPMSHTDPVPERTVSVTKFQV